MERMKIVCTTHISERIMCLLFQTENALIPRYARVQFFGNVCTACDFVSNPNSRVVEVNFPTISMLEMSATPMGLFFKYKTKQWKSPNVISNTVI